MLLANPVNQTERLYTIEQMLSESGAVPNKALLERLEISRATFKRDLDYLCDRPRAPIVGDRDLGGYHRARRKRTDTGITRGLHKNLRRRFGNPVFSEGKHRV